MKLAGLAAVVVELVLDVVVVPPEPPQAAKANAAATMQVTPIPILILNSTLLFVPTSMIRNQDDC